jgi:hypothetical protein
VSDGTNLYAINPSAGAAFEFNSGGIGAQSSGQLNGFVLTSIAPPSSLFFAGGSVWITNTKGQVRDIRDATNVILGGPAAAVNGAAYDGTHVWFAAGDNIFEVRPSAGSGDSGSFVGSYQISKSPVDNLVFDGQFIWAASAGNLIQFDVTTNSIKGSYTIGGNITSVLFDGIYLWIANGVGVTRFDPAKAEQVPLPDRVNGSFTSLAVEGNTVWAFGQGANTATKIRACDGIVTATITLPGPVAQAVFDGQRTWIAYQSGADVISIR